MNKGITTITITYHQTALYHFQILPCCQKLLTAYICCVALVTGRAGTQFKMAAAQGLSGSIRM